MTERWLRQTKKTIEDNVGNLSVDYLINVYEKLLNGADTYLLGSEYDGMAYAIERKHLPKKYCSTQTNHKTNVQYLRFRPHEKGAKEIANNKNAICFGSVNEMYDLYKNKSKQGFNCGYCFEAKVYDYYGMKDEWKIDNKPSTKGGDISVNGKEIQLKFVRKFSCATITSTDRILHEIDRRLSA